MPKPLISEKPYPDLKGVTPDPCTLRIISPAYAGSSGELNAILQFFYHSLALSEGGYGQFADSVLSIAVAEMKHLKLLGEAIYALGAQPVFTAQPPAAFNFYSTKFVSYSRTLKNMLEDDVMSERRTISRYEQMLARLKEGAVKRLIARIAEDERLHLAEFGRILKEITC